MRKLKKIVSIGFAILYALIFCDRTDAQTTPADLRVVLIRHAEKPKKGDNLTCQGLNRAMQLPALLHARFGVPSATYIPSMALGDSTKHCRMFQTIIPFAVKYNLTLTSKFQENDSTGIAEDILQRKGTVLVIWEHKKLVSIARALGINDDRLHWPDDDYDSIWVISFHGGKAKLTKGKEGLRPSTACRF
jgi:hypothetical protein